MALSMADKVKELGFDSDEFFADCSKIDDLMVKMHLAGVYGGGLQDRVKTMEVCGIYPQLRLLKAKYGMNIPITIIGFDIVRLERMIDAKLQDINKGKEVSNGL